MDSLTTFSVRGKLARLIDIHVLIVSIVKGRESFVYPFRCHAESHFDGLFHSDTAAVCLSGRCDLSCTTGNNWFVPDMDDKLRIIE